MRAACSGSTACRRFACEVYKAFYVAVARTRLVRLMRAACSTSTACPQPVLCRINNAETSRRLACLMFNGRTGLVSETRAACRK